MLNLTFSHGCISQSARKMPMENQKINAFNFVNTRKKGGQLSGECSRDRLWMTFRSHYRPGAGAIHPGRGPGDRRWLGLCELVCKIYS